jgi:hypothetical protein
MKSFHLLASMVGCLALANCTNHAPVLLPLQNQTVKTNVLLEFMVTAVDDDGDSLEFGIQGKPAGASFNQIDAHSARFSWTPVASDAGPDGQGKEYLVTFLVTDGQATDSETIIIYVILGGEGTGAPVFITPSDFTLDLNRSDTLRAHIEVRDNDSSYITLRLADNPPGGLFTSPAGSKYGDYLWKPSPEQIAERPLWSIRVGASDGQNPEVFQNITILLKGGAKKCTGTPPRIEHQPLGDQRGSTDYPITVKAFDAESEVAAVALYWMVKGSGGESFTKQSLAKSGADTWNGSIPNPKLSGEQTAEIVYYLCAVDNDDQAGSECDLRACLPESGRFSFLAYPAGSSQCQKDPLEGASGNDTPASATAVVFDQNRQSVMENLRICPGDVDWFRLQVPEGNTWAGALLNHVPANGLLELELYDASGTVLLASGQLDGDDLIVVSEVLAQPTELLLKVQGSAAQVENGYSLLVVWDRYTPCTADSFEPNDNPQNAPLITSDGSTGLSCCGDPDWYRVSLKKGERLEAEIEFSQAKGDLDLALFDSATALGAAELSCNNALACSISETDNEQLALEAAPADGNYYLVVAPYRGARNDYDMLVSITSPACADDADEPNDSPEQAKEIIDGTRSGRKVCPGNDDWYKVYMFEGELLIVDAYFSHARGDIDLRIYGPGTTSANLAQNLLLSSLSSTDNEHLELTVASEGYYYLRISGYQLQNPNSYDLQVRFHY